ncbi:hypothetical protein F4823DRAFT_566474 [Ustulina deusta]|nr:hypothetical protein F4823DRAFT_566474 [Ustulina deusta]
MADELPAFMRELNRGNANIETVAGYRIYNATHLCLLLPAIEALLACSLLAATIFITSGQPLVKNSSIALLLYGLLANDRAELLEKYEVVTEERLERRAETMMARLESDRPGSYRFTKYV